MYRPCIISPPKNTHQHTHLQELEIIFSQLKSNYTEEYTLYNLPTIALACILPHIITMMTSWDPLEHPTQGAPLFQKWRRLLQGGSGRQGPLSQEGDPYVQLVGLVVLPPLRTAVVNRWDPRDPAAMEAFVEVSNEGGP